MIQFKYTVSTPKYITIWYDSISALIHHQSHG